MDNTVEAMRAAGWYPKALARRIKLFDLRTKGVPMEDIIPQLGVSERMAYLDWAAIRKVLNVAAAPTISSIRARADARFERIYMLAMAEIASCVRNRESIPRGMLAEARLAEVARAELYGAIDRRSMALIQMPQLFRGNDLAGKTDEELRALVAAEIEAISKLSPEAAAIVHRDGDNGSPES